MGIRLFDKHLVCNLASVFQMASSPAFNVWMFMWSLRVVVPFFISHSAAASTCQMLTVVRRLGQCGLWYHVHCRIDRSRIPLFVL